MMLQDEETLARLMKQDAERSRQRIANRDGSTGWTMTIQDDDGRLRIGGATLKIAHYLLTHDEATSAQIGAEIGTESVNVPNAIRKLIDRGLVVVDRTEVERGKRRHVYRKTDALGPWVRKYA